jgi:hypothetical protein
VDDEGDVFVNQDGAVAGIVEIPVGPSGPEPARCRRLHLRGEPGYAGGVAIDPKNDDLIVADDPGSCAGGRNGRITIYPKPYARATARVRELRAKCAGAIKLDSTSRLLFVMDENRSGESLVVQASYPQGSPLGTYQGGKPSGVATIPNVLPN